MNSPTVLVILGNRPQFIKHAAVQRAWSALDPDVQMVVVDTGQHYDYGLAGVFLDELAIPAPDVNLAIGSASHAEQLARMLPPLEELMLTRKPASVVVYGDTNSTLGGALAASKLGIPIMHIEAGLRSFDQRMPEEVNRVMTDHVSRTLFCPTQTAVDNLAAEGLSAGVELVGDVMTDIAHLATEGADARWPALRERFGVDDGGFGLVTVHRASNTEPEALAQLLEGFRRSPLPLLFPVHPRTQAAIERAGLHVELTEIEQLIMLPPLGYLDLTATLRHARAIITDSGGLQKEAYVHGVRCITLRDTTEWVETVQLGMNVLVHTDPERIARAIADTEEVPWLGAGAAAKDLPPVYGTGNAAEQIVRLLADHALATRPSFA